MTSKNVIWLVFDSVRGDRTSLGGHGRETTPTLDAIGARPDGLATTGFAHAIWSQPSVASMLTGTYLSTHGSGAFNETLPDDIPTVAERLSAAGYRTVGVSSNPYFSSTTGMTRGFDRFDFVSGSALAREAGLPALVRFLANVRRFSGGLERDRRKHTPDFLLNEIVQDRIREHSGEDAPFFLAAHYAGAHHPYYPAPAFRSEFAGDLPVSADRAAEMAFERTTDVYARIAAGGFESGRAADAVDAMYDAQVRQVDALVERLVNYVDRTGIGDETILVVTSDHGDHLGELGLCSHKLSLHDALVEVPIAVRGSEYLAGADVGLAQHADVIQTILAELGVDTDGMQGQRVDQSPREMAVTQRGGETYRKTMDEVRESAPDFDHEHVFPGFVTALRTDDWKFVSGDDGTALYDLPVEDENVAAAHPSVVDRFESEVDDWLDGHGRHESTATAEFDDEIRARLADLGYVVD